MALHDQRLQGLSQVPFDPVQLGRVKHPGLLQALNGRPGRQQRGARAVVDKNPAVFLECGQAIFCYALSDDNGRSGGLPHDTI